MSSILLVNISPITTKLLGFFDKPYHNKTPWIFWFLRNYVLIFGTAESTTSPNNNPTCYAIMLTSLALAHMVDSVDISCTCTHGRCYAMLTCLALAHMVDATRCWRVLHLHTWLLLRDVDVRCSCTHGRCYAMLTSWQYVKPKLHFPLS